MVVVFLCILNIIPGLSQNYFSSNKSVLDSKSLVDVDSVAIVYKVEFDKETSSEFDDILSFVSTENREVLTKEEIKKLNNYLLSEKSYTNEYAVLSHADILFKYYNNGAEIMFIAISSITRNITIVINSDIIHDKISPQFEKYVTRLLQNKKLWIRGRKFEAF